MNEKILQLVDNFNKDFENVSNKEQLNELDLKYFSKKGLFSELMQNLRFLSNEERPQVGKLINEYKQQLTNLFLEKKRYFDQQAQEEKYLKEKVNIKYDHTNFLKGSIHPLNLIIKDITQHFIQNGYEVVSGPEIEDEKFNFEYMNIPDDHPARNSHDSFYLEPHTLLRTHTSPVQARKMLEKKGENIKLVCPGKVYRRDEDDATHSHQFMQLEGLVVGKNISFANMIDTLKKILEYIFKKDSEIRLRPSYFPFTEPSVEVDVMYTYKNGEKKFIEIMGAGMVHPNVLKMCGYDPKVYSGFAFGLGIERVAMIKYEIDEIREFYTNDLRFLKQF